MVLRFLSILASFSIFAGVSGCSCKKNADGTETCSLDQSPSCEDNGNNVSGHVYYTNSNGVQTSAATVFVAYSTDSFATTNNVVTRLNNAQGMAMVPYDICVPTNTNVQLRAFQSQNDSGAWVSGQPAGRYDGTSNGNSTYANVNVSQPQSSDWNTVGGIDIYLDSTTAQ